MPLLQLEQLLDGVLAAGDLRVDHAVVVAAEEEQVLGLVALLDREVGEAARRPRRLLPADVVRELGEAHRLRA